MALRLLAFKQIFKILGMECIPFHSQSNFNITNKKQAKKRHATNGEPENGLDTDNTEVKSEVEEKKIKETI